ncbi:Gnk2-homologous domain protein [Raphanus sativus]|nr:Gnk2-homologous domain protein [Raphanus sativus]
MNLTNEYLNHKCLNQGKYNSGSAFEKNLNWIFHHITTNSYAATGSAEASIGHTTTPDFVSVIFQCRGDSYGSKCRTCADTAIAGFRKKCPSNKGVIICLASLPLIDTNRAHIERDLGRKRKVIRTGKCFLFASVTQVLRIYRNFIDTLPVRWTFGLEILFADEQKTLMQSFITSTLAPTYLPHLKEHLKWSESCVLTVLVAENQQTCC